MLTEMCLYLHNWFDRDQPKFYGDFRIEGGELYFDGASMENLLKNGQYIRISGSTFNDGVIQYPLPQTAVSEAFNGSIWALAIPPDALSLADDITAWKAKYEAVDASSMSPFNSESFGGYSYSKLSGSTSAVRKASPTSWQDIFASRLNLWRKIR